MMYFSALACCGIVFNVWLYIDDLKNRNGILDAIDKGENLETLMTSPTGENRRKEFDGEDADYQMETGADADVKESLKLYKDNKESRDNLKRSIAKQSMSNN